MADTTVTPGGDEAKEPVSASAPSRFDRIVPPAPPTPAAPAEQASAAAPTPGGDAAAVPVQDESSAPAAVDYVSEEQVVAVPMPNPADAFGAVFPGQHVHENGLVGLVGRSLGMGDIDTYNDAAVAQVKARQSEAGLEPTGVVYGETWALILDEVGPGSRGHAVTMLRNALGLRPGVDYDVALESALAGRTLRDVLAGKAASA